MRKILFVLGSMEYSGAATQVTLLDAGLPRDRFVAHVCALGNEGPVARKLRSAAGPVDVLGNTLLAHGGTCHRPESLRGAGQRSVFAAGKKDRPGTARPLVPA